jgi:predicted ATPase/DNA-binding CsgD family transcriptional regulator
MSIEPKTRHNLPAQPTSFIGRADEIAEIVALLTDPACRLLTLTGLGGIGKTRLALQAAHNTAGHFSNGVFLVPLQPLQTANQVLSAVIEALNLQTSRDPHAELLNWLEDKHLLLIMDNFEHVAEGAGLVTDILAAAPAVKLLVTSREALNMQAEYLWPLHGLDTPPDDMLDGFDDYSAVQLFVERTRRIKPDFSPPAYKHEIVRICRLVDGLPLAIELAAGWTRALSPQAIGDEIQHSIDLLATNHRDVPERHRSIRAVFDHSWRLLLEEERAVFAKLSVFRGGFTLEAAEQVAGASLSLLALLIGKSLLRLEENGRYDLHELVRQYAEEQLEAAHETEAALDAHCRYYAGFLHEHEDAIHDHREFMALNAIHHDFENIRAAWQRAVQQVNESAVGWMLRTLTNFLGRRGRLIECQMLLNQALSGLAPQIGTMPSLVWGRLLVRKHQFAGADYSRDQTIQAYDMLRSELQQILEIFLYHEEKWEIGSCLSIMANLESYMSHYGTAAQLLEQCVNICDKVSDKVNGAEMRLFYALNLRCSGRDPAICNELVKQALEMARSVGAPSGIAQVLLWSAWIHQYDEGDLTAARLANDEALALAAQVGHIGYTAAAWWQKGLIAFSSGHIDESLAIGEKSVEIGTEHDITLIIAYGQALLGLADCLQENYDRGQQRCLAAYQELLGGRRPVRFFDGGADRPRHFFWSLGLAIAGCGLTDICTVRKHLVSMLQTAVDLQVLVYKLLCLPCSAVPLAGDGQFVRAVEVLALAYTHPKSPTGWMEQWPLLARLQADLEQALGSEAYSAAWERGKTLDLDTTARELLAEFTHEATTLSVHVHTANTTLPEPLTARELEVLALIADGLTNHEIARQLFIGVSTVKKHIQHIYAKLGTKNRTSAVLRARELKLLP